MNSQSTKFKMINKLTYCAFILFIIQLTPLNSISSEQCRVLNPYCNCNLNSTKEIINKTIEFDGVLLNCEEIIDLNLFFDSLLIIRDQKFNLKIYNTKHEVVQNILNYLASSSLRTSLNGLILSNLTYIKESTFDFNLLNFNRLNFIQFNFNQVNFLNCSQFNRQLRLIDLSKNQLKTIYGCSLVGDFVNLTFLDLSRNNLKFFELNRLNDVNQNLKFNLAFNEWECDASLEPLINLVHQEPTKFQDNNQMKCSSPNKLSNLIFKYVHEIRNTEICSKCECYSLQRGTSIGLNCTGRGLTELPAKIPSTSKIVILDHNSIKNLNFKKFNEKELLVWSKVIHLSIRHNEISSLEGLNFTVLRNVRALNLSHNSLTTLPAEISSKMFRVELLTLGSNPWICDCSTRSFQSWLRNRKQVDLESIKCDDQDQPIYKLDPDEICIKNGKFYYWNIANICLSITILLLLIKLIYDYIWKIQTQKLPYFFKLNC